MTSPFSWWTRLSPSPPEPRFETVATGTEPSVSHSDISCRRVVLDLARLRVSDPPRVACNENCRKGLVEITEVPITLYSKVQLLQATSMQRRRTLPSLTVRRGRARRRP